MYLVNEAKKKYFNLDQEQIREYFPLDPVLTEIFGVYSELLSIKITKMEGVSTWHPTVSVYEVAEVNSNIIGYFYLDLLSRPGKYAHQCVFPMIPSFSDGKQEIDFHNLFRKYYSEACMCYFKQLDSTYN